MGELWRDLVEMLRQHPLLWLPVLVADLLGSLLNVLRGAAIRAVLLHETAQHSALGGAVIHAPLSGSAAQSATVIALLLTWLVYFLRILLYSAALISTAALVWGYLHREKHPEATLGRTLAARWGGILELALRALAVYAVAAVLFSALTPLLARVNHGALLRSSIPGVVMTLLILIVLSALLPPAALRVLSEAWPGLELKRLSQQFSFVLVLVAALMASVISANNRQLSQLSTAGRNWLEGAGSLLVALPYVLLFVGLALLAKRVPAVEPAEEPEAI